MSAYEAAKPLSVRLPGLQQFAAAVRPVLRHAVLHCMSAHLLLGRSCSSVTSPASPRHLDTPVLPQVWERRRRIPSQTYNDPLDHIFTEFDEDGDGHLTADEIASALQSRGVQADTHQIQDFIDGASHHHQRCCWALHLLSFSFFTLEDLDARRSLQVVPRAITCLGSKVPSWCAPPLPPLFLTPFSHPFFTPLFSPSITPMTSLPPIAAIDLDHNGTVERSEFADFIFHLAVADLHAVSPVD